MLHQSMNNLQQQYIRRQYFSENVILYLKVTGYAVCNISLVSLAAIVRDSLGINRGNISSLNYSSRFIHSMRRRQMLFCSVYPQFNNFLHQIFSWASHSVLTPNNFLDYISYDRGMQYSLCVLRAIQFSQTDLSRLILSLTQNKSIAAKKKVEILCAIIDYAFEISDKAENIESVSADSENRNALGNHISALYLNCISLNSTQENLLQDICRAIEQAESQQEAENIVTAVIPRIINLSKARKDPLLLESAAYIIFNQNHKSGLILVQYLEEIFDCINETSNPIFDTDSAEFREFASKFTESTLLHMIQTARGQYVTDEYIQRMSSLTTSIIRCMQISTVSDNVITAIFNSYHQNIIQELCSKIFNIYQNTYKNSDTQNQVIARLTNIFIQQHQVLVEQDIEPSNTANFRTFGSFLSNRQDIFKIFADLDSENKIQNHKTFLQNVYKDQDSQDSAMRTFVMKYKELSRKSQNSNSNISQDNAINTQAAFALNISFFAVLISHNIIPNIMVQFPRIYSDLFTLEATHPDLDISKLFIDFLDTCNIDDALISTKSLSIIFGAPTIESRMGLITTVFENAKNKHMDRLVNVCFELTKTIYHSKKHDISQYFPTVLKTLWEQLAITKIKVDNEKQKHIENLFFKINDFIWALSEEEQYKVVKKILDNTNEESIAMLLLFTNNIQNLFKSITNNLSTKALQDHSVARFVQKITRHLNAHEKMSTAVQHYGPSFEQIDTQSIISSQDANKEIWHQTKDYLLEAYDSSKYMMTRETFQQEQEMMLDILARISDKIQAKDEEPGLLSFLELNQKKIQSKDDSYAKSSAEKQREEEFTQRNDHMTQSFITYRN